MRNSWTDDRLDDLARRMDAGFASVDAELKVVRGEVAAQGSELRQAITAQGSELRRAITAQGSELRGELAERAGELREELAEQARENRALGRELRQEIATRFDLLEGRFELARAAASGR